ncbi:MAG: EAL domain-containing protein [Actinomycetota bacterium]
MSASANQYQSRPVDEGPIRVLVAEDEPVVRAALTELVASDSMFELVGSARDAEEAIALAEVTRPHVALVDVRMPGGGGLRVTKELHERMPETRVVAHTAVGDRATVVQMLHVGAAGYLVKGTPASEILRAIVRAAHGELSVSREVMSDLVDDLAQQIHHAQSETEERRARVDRIEEVIQGVGRSLVFQPIVELAGHRLVGMEALSRFVATDEAWPVNRWFEEAAAVGLGTELEMACNRDAVKELFRLPSDAYISMNVSNQTARSESLLETLATIDASRVVIEITEHEAVQDYEGLTAALARVRELGTRVAIDDAGAGFASLRHILLIDPEIIKLDVSLARGIDSDPRRKALAAALTSFAGEMEIGVVAEGIETREEHAALRALGVTLGQGYYLGRPAPLEDVLLLDPEEAAR